MADDLELSAVLDLLTELRELPPGASVPEGLRYRLLGAARGMGAGALGVRGKERERLRSALGDDPSARERLLGFLDDGSPDVRSWAGSYVEQLLPEDEAVESLTEALREEADGEAASWLAMSLARVTPR
ncbi:MAG TPA: hypothetical protein VLL48_13965, partial [Longimicrobiales bacterium]|nr:hypothetical protein [Longimicrobiales bacterium]